MGLGPLGAAVGRVALPAGGAELASHEQNRDAEDPGASVSPIRWRWIGRKASNGMRSGNGVPMNRVSYEISLGKKAGSERQAQPSPTARR
jgi:hypothetical protein